MLQWAESGPRMSGEYSQRPPGATAGRESPPGQLGPASRGRAAPVLRGTQKGYPRVARPPLTPRWPEAPPPGRSVAAGGAVSSSLVSRARSYRSALGAQSLLGKIPLVERCGRGCVQMPSNSRRTKVVRPLGYHIMSCINNRWSAVFAGFAYAERRQPRVVGQRKAALNATPSTRGRVDPTMGRLGTWARTVPDAEAT